MFAIESNQECSVRVPVTCNGVICCSALLDSGNLYRNVCSLNFLQRLGLSRKDIVPLRVDTVGTAEAGSKMRILGETRFAISAQLGDHPTKIHFKPVVIEKLITELIIGAPFMKKHNIDQLHSRGCITFQGKEIPVLPPHITGPISLEDHHRPLHYVRVGRKVLIPPRHEKNIEVIVVMENGKRAAEQTGLVRGSFAFDHDTQLASVRNVLVKTDEKGRAVVSVLNLSNRAVHIQAATFFGCFEPCEILENELASSLMTAAIQTRTTAAEDKPPEMPTEPAVPSTLAEFVSAFALKDKTVLPSQMEVKKAAALLRKFADVFAFDNAPGDTSLVEHRIKLVPNARPVRAKYRPLNPVLEEDFRRQLDSWLRQKLVRKSNSEWSSALVPVKKKNGKIRWA